MSDIFREVDEEYNKDRALEFWKKYGPAIIGGVAAIVAAVVLYSFWQSYSANQRAKQSDKFVAALELLENDTQPSEAARSFAELAESSSSGYKILSSFLHANSLTEAGQVEESLSVYEGIIVNSNADKVMRDLARVKAAYLVVDTASLDEMNGRVAALMDGKNPWRHSARQLIAIAAFREGDVERARTEFLRLLSDPGTPQNMRALAQEMLGVLGPVEPRTQVDTEPRTQADTQSSSEQIEPVPVESDGDVQDEP